MVFISNSTPSLVLKEMVSQFFMIFFKKQLVEIIHSQENQKNNFCQISMNFNFSQNNLNVFFDLLFLRILEMELCD